MIFRSTADYYHGFNCLALAAFGTDTSLMSEAEMSTHAHVCARTADYRAFVHDFRYPYSRYFNNKYKRSGRLGERVVFVNELEGLYHTLSAISYTLRNPVHHGIVPTPFAYPHSSATALFRKALGRNDSEPVLSDRFQRRFLPSRAEYPNSYKMSASGLFLRETVLDVQDVEHMFGTPRAFLYYMNRLSGEEWKREQEKDANNLPPITLELMESGVGLNPLSVMMSNENARFNYNAMTDIQLCELIDDQLLPKYTGKSVYELSRTGKEQLGNYLCAKYNLSKDQVSRCIAYK